MRSKQEIIERLITLIKEAEECHNQEVTWSDGEFNPHHPDDIDTADRIRMVEDQFHSEINILKWILKYQRYDDHVVKASVIGRINE